MHGRTEFVNQISNAVFSVLKRRELLNHNSQLVIAISMWNPSGQVDFFFFSSRASWDHSVFSNSVWTKQ